MLIACIDADYRDDSAITACVAIREWTDEAPVYRHAVRRPEVARDYEPGAFYKRELPGTLAILAELAEPIDVVVIDGYVWLARERPGLGARLFEELDGRVPVIGVAKTRFHANDAAIEVVRGGSTKPLYVTSEGIDVNEAAAHVARMHGPHRLPTVLKLVDRLARDS